LGEVVVYAGGIVWTVSGVRFSFLILPLHQAINVCAVFGTRVQSVGSWAVVMRVLELIPFEMKFMLMLLAALFGCMAQFVKPEITI
jgi:hypothetical protein